MSNHSIEEEVGLIIYSKTFKAWSVLSGSSSHNKLIIAANCDVATHAQSIKVHNPDLDGKNIVGFQFPNSPLSLKINVAPCLLCLASDKSKFPPSIFTVKFRNCSG